MRFRPGRYVVTGAASGIGAACARALAEAGCDLVLIDRNERELEAVGGGLRSPSVAVQTRVADVTDGQALPAAVAALGPGGFSGLVNAAGVLQLGSILDVDEDDWDRVVDVNLKGTYLSCRALIPALAESGGGSVVNLASVSGRTKSIYSAPNYVASKAGVIGLTMTLAAQHAGQGIRVNCIAPGLVETPMLAVYSDEQRRAMEAMIPLGRFADTSEVAAAVAFLLSDEASYITGQTLCVNGGQFML